MPDDLALRSIWLAIAVLAGSIVGTGAGVLTKLAGGHPAKAVVAGGTGFGGTLLIILAAFSYLGD